MKNLLIKIGKKSKKAFSFQISSQKKNKVLNDYCLLIQKNKKKIIKQNQKDLKNALRKKIKSNLIERLIILRLQKIYLFYLSRNILQKLIHIFC